MKLQVKSNGHIVEMKKEIFNSMPEDQKRSYLVISEEENQKDQPVENKAETKVPKPESGEKK